MPFSVQGKNLWNEILERYEEIKIFACKLNILILFEAQLKHVPHVSLTTIAKVFKS